MQHKNVIGLLLAAVMTVSINTVPGFAAETKTATTTVSAEVGSSYTVTVPESITLTNANGGSGVYTGTVSINIKGDIGTTEAVTLTATPPTMTEKKSSASVTATFATNPVPKSKWTCAELKANDGAGTSTTYSITATLTPGSWTGTATFACTLA